MADLSPEEQAILEKALKNPKILEAISARSPAGVAGDLIGKTIAGARPVIESATTTPLIGLAHAVHRSSMADKMVKPKAGAEFQLSDALPSKGPTMHERLKPVSTNPLKTTATLDREDKDKKKEKK